MMVVADTQHTCPWYRLGNTACWMEGWSYSTGPTRPSPIPLRLQSLKWDDRRRGETATSSYLPGCTNMQGEKSAQGVEIAVCSRPSHAVYISISSPISNRLEART